MDFQILMSNLTNPTLLFFALGTFAVIVKSDLRIPKSISKFKLCIKMLDYKDKMNSEVMEKVERLKIKN